MISYLVLIPFVVVILFLLFSIIPQPVRQVPQQPVQPEHKDEFMSVQVAAYEGKAYWIINNQLFRADLTESGDVDRHTTEAVDSMTVDADEMPLLFNIIEALKQHGA